ncbi:hypothetical protein AURDEDRAFT_117025 [Auricularia subglabra TFB-10046 SS5]|uniref:Uncharacterized protein n=1 Tax=Auricularia subglabra (strain TFB-10046 / SS5) TaxID=717982 RepID=J0D9Z2_AURST|nr:hypothetical protein AURDEDRAFT_117025 [Auricularia subglabra TFB-10046 SS5]
MSHFSPPTVLLWAVLSIMLQTFLVTHLWKFDRFQCLRWNAGKQPGAFQRVMTYTYLATMPLLVIFSVTMTVIKYREGYVALPPPPAGATALEQESGLRNPDQIVILLSGPIIPKPFELWHKSSYDLVFPLYLLFSVAWSFEMVTHLEEFNFWLFLINTGERQRTWFGSGEFQSWIIGSLTAVVAMPLVAIFTRKNFLELEAWVFFVGSLGSSAITIMFIYVLWRFPVFLRRIRQGGAPPAVIVRLTGFHELNVIRVIFRFLFTLPLFIMALDGIRKSDHHPINQSAVSTDFLGALGGIGCMVSSTLTLLVFFPRSITESAGYNPREASTSIASHQTHIQKHRHLHAHHHHRAPVSPVSPFYDDEDDEPLPRSPSLRSDAVPMQELPPAHVHPHAHEQRPRRSRRPRSAPAGSLHPFIADYTSPINFADVPSSDTDLPRHLANT